MNGMSLREETPQTKEIHRAGNLAFLLLGFGPFRLAQRGLLTALALVGVVSLPLGVGFSRMIEQNAIVRALEGQEIAGVILREAALLLGDYRHLSAKLLSPATLTRADLERVKQAIESRLGRRVTLEAAVVVVL